MNKQLAYVTGNIASPAGDIPKVSTTLSGKDILQTIGVRWDINRDSYTVAPGLYAVGEPGAGSDVFVTANYKFSFDVVRKNLSGLNAWILVLDTKGINVWCAAGKGTFGTKELVNRIRLTSLENIIAHKRLILPQLGAVGVSAHKVKEETGFTVIYGPVRAADIREFVDLKYKPTREMRKVTFPFKDRMKQIPVDSIYRISYLFGAFILFFLLSGINHLSFSLQLAVDNGLKALLSLFLGYIAGIVFTPLLLPYIPAKRFALKGMIMGIIVSVILLFFHILGNGLIEIVSWFLMISAISSFMAMNFTGSSTYTSLSGVQKEMKVAVPVQISFAGIGFILFVISKFV